ncbi:hypothetical protein F0562_018536 [Nyssa sinensis]|uniref:Dof zinc finger protein n=1 Tax=Nyssa sinensis TaxID=561372 RepID=A0A5J4ZBX7_9ASTE|nr:hypothetical protein F0562_018536 [Nyssa sinensis]
MLGNCERMIVIPSTTNQWPQNQIDEKDLMASTGRVMEKPSQDQNQNQNQNQQQALKCPRCDSSNTKFCYYNNYSLSQPRHFCKACKRYWTRGGTLRNVPVGGGCRKNKRVKRPASAMDAPSSSAPTSTANHTVQPQIDLTPTSNHINSLFYGLPTNHSELNLPYPRFNSRASNDSVSGYDLQPQFNALGLGFSSGLMASDHVRDESYQNRSNPTQQVQDHVVTSDSLLSSYPIFGSSSTSTSTSPTLASFIASSGLQQHKFISSGLKDIRAANGFQGLIPYEDLQMPGTAGEGGTAMKEVKTEGGQNGLDNWNVPCQNQIEQISSSDPSLYWNATSGGAWLDPANLGSSVPSLI